jgi:3'(2'), 5'-bisphosphate nucleotidase
VTPIPADVTGLIDELTGIVARASAAILEVRARGLATRTKADASPVTACDEAAEAIILDGLARLLPGVPVVSEEAFAGLPGAKDLVLVDPLDGTRELVAGRDEFCVNVALVRDGRPCLGIIAAPALGLIWRTAASGGAERLRLMTEEAAKAGEERVAIRPRPWPQTGAIAAISRSHLDAQTSSFLAEHLPSAQKTASGSALKFCRIAEGQADVYPRFSPVNQWDVAAGDAILTAAGGTVTTPKGGPIPYGSGSVLVPGFIAWGDPAAARNLGFA